MIRHYNISIAEFNTTKGVDGRNTTKRRSKSERIESKNTTVDIGNCQVVVKSTTAIGATGESRGYNAKNEMEKNE